MQKRILNRFLLICLCKKYLEIPLSEQPNRHSRLKPNEARATAARHRRNTRDIGDRSQISLLSLRRGRGVSFFAFSLDFFFFAEICILLKCRPRASGSYHRYATLIKSGYTLRTVRQPKAPNEGSINI